jgi:hypothetical protein
MRELSHNHCLTHATHILQEKYQSYTIFVLQITNLIGDELFIQTKGSGVAQLQVIYIVYRCVCVTVRG